MKRYLVIIFLLLAFFAAAKVKGNIFAEEMTATSCHACPAVAEILHEIYSSHDYPFYYVAMVTDKNDLAAERAREYNVYGYPTTFFDGGYEVIFGKQDMQYFKNAIQSCLERQRANVKINLGVKWLGENSIEIDLGVKNNGNEDYNGFLKVYVVEPVSRWKDYDGKPYHFGFLDYAVNEDISLAPGEKINKQSIWNGSERGYEISKDNIMAIAVVFNANGNTKYSDPPENNHPFTAYYVDACTAAKPSPDEPPSLQFIKKPGNVTGYRYISFEWTGSDDHGNVLFSYKLMNYDKDWSDWSNITHAEYANLPDGEYEFLLRGKDNIGQISQISWRFIVDTSSPRVVEHYPKANAKNVPVYVTIRIKFSHEMNKKSVENGLEIEPYVDYTVQWKNANEILIYPQTLNYETKYTVIIRNAYRKSGQMLQYYEFSFETSAMDVTPPHILYVKPLNAELIGNIEIKFSEPMDTLLHRAIEIEPWVPFTYEWKENDTLLEIKFSHYNIGSYNITITTYITDKYGNNMEKNFTFYVYITPPKIIYSNIEDGERNVALHTLLEIKFSHEMDQQSVEKNLNISPECTHNISWSDSTLLIDMQLEYGKIYYVNISKNARDIRSIKMEKNFSIHFSTLKEIERNGGKNETPSFMLLMAIIAILLATKRRKLK